MKVIEATNYNREFPEQFTWGHLDSIKHANLAATIVNHIEHDLHNIPQNRNVTPGLRLALNLIAEVADL